MFFFPRAVGRLRVALARVASRSLPSLVLGVVVLLANTASNATAQVTEGSISIRLKSVGAGLSSPVDLTHAGDGSERLFVADQTGQIRIIQNGEVAPTPFLDISDRLPALNAGFDERGLLGLTFHPNYEENGRFFVRYSRPRTGDASEPCFDSSRGCHEELLSEFRITSENEANPDSERILFRVDEPQFNHNAGALAFGPDGHLYFGLGDGGGANDSLDDPELPHGPLGNGQNVETHLGSILRIDVDSPHDPGLEYAIPTGNPFADSAGQDEIYAFGFRNPFKLSFDDGPGGDNSLLVADVGQNVIEEIDRVEAGGNYGWATREGTQCFDPLDPQNPPATCSSTGPSGEPLLDPIAEYTHDDGISVIGGFVYRGSKLPQLEGKYVFGDFSDGFASPGGRLFYLDADGDPSQIFEFQLGPNNDPLGLFLKGFGEDESGELYVLASSVLGPFGESASGLGQQVFLIIPEPSSVSLTIAAGLGALMLVRRKK